MARWIARARQVGGLGLLAAALAGAGAGWAGEPVVIPDPGFQPSFTTTRGAALYAVTLQPDGRVLVAGEFALVNGLPRRSLARLHDDGTVDATFDARGGVAGVVYDLAVAPGGDVLIAGQFASVDGVAREGVARLQPDGRLDPSFHPRFEGPEGWFAGAVLVQPDGRILVAGRFETVNGLPRDGVVRLDRDGRVDAGFDPGSGLNGGTAYALALQADGRLLVGGAFAVVGTVFSPGIVRLGPAGEVDLSFIGGIFAGGNWGRVFALTIQPEFGIVVVGEFDTVDLTARNRMARLQWDGSLDPGFDPQEGIAGGEEALLDVVSLNAGRVVVTGSFASAAGAELGSLAGFTATGSVDAAFDPGPGLEAAGPGIGSMLAVQPDGRIIAVGRFQNAGGAPRHCVARFRPDGSLDETFSTTNAFFEFVGSVRALHPLPDGGWLAGGDFERVDGVPRTALARLEASGRLDPDFEAALNPDAVVNAIARDSAGRWVVGGDFDTVGDVEQANLVRLLPDGTRDETFVTAGPDAAVQAVVVEPTGDMLAAGRFVRVDNLRRLGVARWHEDGAVDPDFEPRFERELDQSAVHALLVAPDGSILAGGDFTRVNGETRPHLARLRPDGTLDVEFGGTLELGGDRAAVHALAPGHDGRVLVGGSFASVNGIPQAGLVRLRTDGAPDDTFRVGTGVGGDPEAAVQALAVLPDGRIAVGGKFWLYRDEPVAHGVLLTPRGDRAGGDGALGTDGPVAVLAADPVGHLLAGGDFFRVGHRPQVGLVRFTVVPAAPEIYLEITRDALGALLVVWEGEGTLQEAWRPDGPWDEVPGAVSPYPPPAGAGSRYYRLRAPVPGGW